MERLAALEAEVKSDADAQRARKEAALSRVREQRAEAEAERAELRDRQTALVTKKRSPASDLGGALELAGKANELKAELVRKPGKGQKSVVKSALASTLLGPLGWLYAGSWREAVPAGTIWLVVLAIASKIPALVIMPVILALLVAMPLSGVAGAIYAMQYNRSGKRQRLWGDEKKQLPAKTGP